MKGGGGLVWERWGGEEEAKVYGRIKAHRPQLLRNLLMTELTTM